MAYTSLKSAVSSSFSCFLSCAFFQRNVSATTMSAMIRTATTMPMLCPAVFVFSLDPDKFYHFSGEKVVSLETHRKIFGSYKSNDSPPPSSPVSDCSVVLVEVVVVAVVVVVVMVVVEVVVLELLVWARATSEKSYKFVSLQKHTGIVLGDLKAKIYPHLLHFC